MKVLVLLAAAVFPAILSPSLQASELKMDAARSWVKVDVRATGHAFTGSLNKFTARATGDPGTLQPSGGRVEWDFADLDTDEPKRNVEMRKWLEYPKSPKGTFQLAKSWTDRDGRVWVQGPLTFHAVSKQVAFPITVGRKGERVTADGQFWIDYRDYNLPVLRKAVITVDPKLKVSFHLEGTTK